MSDGIRLEANAFRQDCGSVPESFCPMPAGGLEISCAGIDCSPMPPRKIIHIDMDAFYASVEQRDDPSLKGKPVIVGGLPGTRGVVCTCSYEARKFGVHSAMSSSRAFKLCPHGIFLKPRFGAYEEASKRIRRIFSDYSDAVEPLSLDEAFLDVTSNKRGLPYATRMAREIKARIREETGGLTASAGVSFNKFLAKVASDLRKPDGLSVIKPEDADAFLAALPIGKFYGIGKVTERLLIKEGIRTGGDLRRLSKLQLASLFGSSGEFYYDIARGVDERPVRSEWIRKSLGTERTFESDLDDVPEMVSIVRELASSVAEDLRRQRLKGRTVTLKVKFFDFRNITRSLSLPEETDDAGRIGDTAAKLLTATEAGPVKVRLLGVTVSGFPEGRIGSGPVQMEFEFR